MPPIEAKEIDRRLAGGPWRRAGGAIERELDLGDFTRAIHFVNEVAALAEAANHHPDILVHSYRRVRLTLTTHSAGGVTDADLALARRVDALADG